MKFLLISTRMGTAGVETLILRMAKYLSENGHIVDVLLMREVETDMANKLRQNSRVYIGWQYWKTNRALKNLGANYYDCIYAYSFFPLIYTIFIRARYFPQTKVCMGVYHPLEYCWVYKSNTKLAKLAAEVMRSFPQENIYFQNEAVKQRHVEKLNIDLSMSPIIPAPVDTDRFSNLERTYSIEQPFKIVSIGRITDFKTYNFTMIKVISELIFKGFNVEYHIYGGGEQLDELHECIVNQNMQNYIYAHGEISYQDFSKVLEDAFLFIGLGTALVEAASCKVPCLQAIEMDQHAESYGFFHDSIGFNVGEKNLNQPRYKIVDLLVEFINITPVEYKEICQLSYIRSQDFDIKKNMQLFLSSCKIAKPLNYKFKKLMIFSSLLNVVFWFFCKKMNIRTPFDSRYVD